MSLVLELYVLHDARSKIQYINHNPIITVIELYDFIMDASLSSSRYSREGNANGGSYRGRGFRGGQHSSYRGGGPVRFDGASQSRQSARYAPYPARGAGRFHGLPQQQQQHQNQYYQPQSPPVTVDSSAVMIQTLTSMIAQMGDWAAAVKRLTELEPMDPTMMQQPQRGVVRILAKNIQDLVEFLCTEKNAPLFLTFDKSPTSSSIQDVAGPLVTLIVSCSATMPTQTSCYAGLTLAVEEYLAERQAIESESEASSTIQPTWKFEYQGFAQRCIDYACHRLFTHVDTILGLHTTMMNPKDFEDIFVDTFLRCKLILRYLALLTQVGLLTSYSGHEETILSMHPSSKDDLVMDESAHPWETVSTSMTLTHVLVLLTQCAKNAATKTTSSTASHNLWTNVSVLLSHLVLSTIPYGMSCIPSHVVYKILDEMESFLFSSHNSTLVTNRGESSPRYKSPFAPGKGIHAILLEHEQKDDPIDPAMDDEEEEEEEEEEDEGPVCADSLQDLFRTIRKLTQGFYDSMSCSSNNVLSTMTQFCFLWDQPWACLSRPSSDTNTNMNLEEQDKSPLVYTGKSMYMTLPHSCQFASILLSVKNAEKQLTSSSFQCHRIDGVIFGRLAMFENLADEENEETGGSPQEEINEILTPMDSYIKTFKSTDRYFLNDVTRDVLIAYRPKVSDTGIEKGSCKEAAEQLWAVHFLFSPKDHPSHGSQDFIQGIEYGIIETLLALLIQSPSTTLSNSCPLSHIYLSRVVLELIKYQPQVITPCLAVAVSITFEHVIPTLTPQARENFTKWFAFHLNNTDYQWSSDCWNLWAPYAVKGLATFHDQDASEEEDAVHSKRNSRGEFVSDAVHFMMELVSSPDIVATECIPHQRALVEFIGSSFHESGSVANKASNPVIATVEKALMDKIWKQKEDPTSIADYLIKETASLCQDDGAWLRTGMIIRSLFHPATSYRLRLDGYINSALEDVSHTSSSEDNTNDVLRDIGDTLLRYKNVIIAAVTRDASGDDSEGNAIQVVKGFFKGIFHALSRNVTGEGGNHESPGNDADDDRKMEGHVFIITEVKKLLSFSDSLFHACLVMLVKVDVVNEFSVLRWSLGDTRLECSPDNIHRVSDQWWKQTAAAISIGVSTRMIATDPDVSDIGKLFTIRVTLVTDFVKEMLKCASKFVEEMTVKQINPKHPSAWEVDLNEGLKNLKSLSIGFVISAVRDVKDISNHLKNSNASSVEELVESLGLK